MYSCLGGKYSRIFVGLSDGWYVPGAEAPSCDDILENLEKIRNIDKFEIPLSGLEEMDSVIRAREALGISKA